jgi:hypothetical protein
MDLPRSQMTGLMALLRFLAGNVTDFKRGASGLPPKGKSICPMCGVVSRPAQHVSGAKLCPFCGQTL